MKTSLTNRNLEYSDVFFGEGSLNHESVNGVETIREAPKRKHGDEIVQTTTSHVDGSYKSESSKNP